MERLADKEPELARTAIESLKTEVRSSTSSMTGIPRPFKFLKPHYERIKQAFANCPDSLKVGNRFEFPLS